MRILVTGGAGFIGSHTVKELIKAGYKDILVIDNLSKGKKEAVLAPAKLIIADLKDKKKVIDIIKEYQPDVVIHFAAAKLADESVTNPLKYYEENITGGLNLLEAMVDAGTKKIIFSSSAAVYGNAENMPITEKEAVAPINPYGRSKLFFEEILADFDEAYGMKSVSLRYFNAGGADVDGELGNECDKRCDLISILVETAAGKREKFVINGEYDTPDHSPIRDLIHVNDLAIAHVLAIDYLNNNLKSEIINLGSEKGFSVKESAFKTQEISGVNFPIEIGPRRIGDPVVIIASSDKAKRLLNWEQKYSDLDTIIRTAYDWEKVRSKTLK